MQTVSLSKIQADPKQPRKYFDIDTMTKLKDSIKLQGIINPLIVEKKGDMFALIDGERRFRAATQLKLKEVPIIVVSSKNPLDRLVEQFHIQEQHEAWTMAEKAMAVFEIVETSGKTLTEVADMLAISDTNLRSYNSFSKIMNKDVFSKYRVNIKYAPAINAIRNMVKDTKRNILEEPFTMADERKLENLLIGKIVAGEIDMPTQFSKIKDSFTAAPKMIDVFMKDNTEVDTLFVNSKAQGAYHSRNLIHSAGYVNFHGKAFLAGKNSKLSDNAIKTVKNAQETIAKILKMVE